MKYVLLFFLLACTTVGAETGTGERIFNSSCAACHTLDGRGGGHAPSIASGSAVQSYPDERIANIIRNGVPSSGMPSFASLSQADVAAVVQYLRKLQSAAVSGSSAGDVQAGRALFFGKAGCSECHMANGSGGFLASDLTGTRLTGQAIREAILHPPATVNDRITSVTLTDGKRLSGLIRNEDNFSVQLQAPDGTYYLLEKATVKTIDRSAQTFMPGDYANRLTGMELDNVVAFLASLRQQP